MSHPRRYKDDWRWSNSCRWIWWCMEGDNLHNEIITVKVLRLYSKSDTEKLLKVVLLSIKLTQCWITLQEISTEAVRWRQLDHPNVLPFYGVFHLNNERIRVCLVSPWMEHGNIIQFLEKRPDVNCIPLVSKELSWPHYLTSLTLLLRYLISPKALSICTIQHQALFMATLKGWVTQRPNGKPQH